MKIYSLYGILAFLKFVYTVCCNRDLSDQLDHQVHQEKSDQL